MSAFATVNHFKRVFAAANMLASVVFEFHNVHKFFLNSPLMQPSGV